MKEIVCILIGYFLGCINMAFIVGKLNGFDIRERGSGNAGASNVKIALGWKAGVFTALFDILKSFAAVMVCRLLFPDFELGPYIAGAMAVIGHIFPFYMKFKGGKGYAAYMGLLLAINWKLALALIVWGVLVTLITNYIALATISTSMIVPAYCYLMKRPLEVILIFVGLMIIIIYKHKINIVRIWKHEEIGLRKTENPKAE